MISVLTSPEPAAVPPLAAAPAGDALSVAPFAALLAGSVAIGPDQRGEELPGTGTSMPDEADPVRDDDEPNHIPSASDVLPPALALAMIPPLAIALPQSGNVSPLPPTSEHATPRSERRDAKPLPASLSSKPSPPPPAKLPTPQGMPVRSDAGISPENTSPSAVVPTRTQAAPAPTPVLPAAAVVIAPEELRPAAEAAAISQSTEPPAKPPPTGERTSPSPVTLSTARQAVASIRPARQTRAAAADQVPSPQATAAPAIGGDLGPLIGQREPAIPSAPGQATPSPHPAHDFRAIVDRLIDARQAGASVATGTTVAHREFGHVRLRLNERDGALGITLSSPDPGFAAATETAIRAAAAATSLQADVTRPPAATPAPAGDAQSTSSQAQNNSTDTRQSSDTATREPAERPATSRSSPAGTRTPAAKPGGGIYA